MKRAWKKYLNRQKPEYMRALIPEKNEADIIIVIPCYDEPDIISTLKNICECERPDANILVVVVINSGENSDERAVLQNRETYNSIKVFSEIIKDIHFSVLPFVFEDLPKKHAGVGLARKIGMDLAVEHFYKTGTEKGIIISLDADCKVSHNFLTGIYDKFMQDDKLNGTIQNFHHRVDSSLSEIEFAVRQYEAYLHYFSYSLKWIGFPYHYHTIGSAFAVSADAYVRVGGMGRQQGGEDFYFLQKVFVLGNIKELEDIYVYPQARFSDRVPFGTGPALQKILDEPDKILKVYSRESFYELKRFFDLKETFFKKSEDLIVSIVSELHPAVVEFLNENSYLEFLKDCNENCASINSFIKRFFHHFNAFRIIKYLNFVHPEPFQLEKITSVSDKI